MAELDVTITKSGTGATYAKSGSGPGSVESDGTISFRGQTPENMSISWSLDSSWGDVTFAGQNAFQVAVPAGLFGAVIGSGSGSLTVSDADGVDNLQGYEYTLVLSDGTVLDPRIINR